MAVYSSHGQESTTMYYIKMQREDKIKEFNESAAKNAAMYAAYQPTPTFTISDDFKVKYKYCKAWVQDDILRIATDAKINNVKAQVLFHNKSNEGYKGPLATVEHKFGNAPVFSDRITLSELRDQMPAGTSGYYFVTFTTTDGQYVMLDFDGKYAVKSTKQPPPPVAPNPKLLSIDIEFVTQEHDKEANNTVYIDCFSRTKDGMVYSANGQWSPTVHVMTYSVQDPAKWDYQDRKSFNIKITKPTFMADFNQGGSFQVHGVKGDIWKFLCYINFTFADNTIKRIRWGATFSGDNYPGFDFDKDFKVIKRYTD